MHKLILKQARFSNILSYGKNINVIDFTDGITWLKGVNGVGKSTIIEVLNFLFFGTAYRDISIENLINSINKKGLIVELDFDRIDNKGTVSYTVCRGLKPKIFTVIKDGVKQAKEAGISQAIFETEILGFDKRLFVNVISLNTLQTDPFLDMSPDDKRKLIESIISLDISKIKKRNSEELTHAKTKFQTTSNDIRSYAAKVIELEGILATLEVERTQGISVLTEDLKLEESQLENLKAKQLDLTEACEKTKSLGIQTAKELEAYKTVADQIRSIETVVSLINQIPDKRVVLKSKELDMQEKTSKATAISEKMVIQKKVYEEKTETFKLLPNVDEQISEATYKKRVAETNRENARKAGLEAKGKIGVPCPTCGKPSTAEESEGILKKYREDFSAYKTEALEAEAILLQCTPLKDQWNTAKAELDALYKELNDESTKLTLAQKDLSYAQSTLDSNKQSLLDAIAKVQAILPSFSESTTQQDALAALEKEKQELLLKKDISDSLSSKLSQLRETLSAINANIKSGSDLVSASQSKIATISDRIAKKKLESGEDSISLTKKQIEGSKSDLALAYEKSRKYSDEIEILNFIGTMLGDEGIKKHVIGTFVPVLNKAIANNLKIFGLPFSIEFDEALNYSFSNNFGTAEVYHGLSQGQKRKLHFSISMAFRDFVTMIGDFSINVLFLDEVLDISVDEAGLEYMLEILKDKVKDVGGIYFMSHRAENHNLEFAKIVEIFHDGSFSRIAA